MTYNYEVWYKESLILASENRPDYEPAKTREEAIQLGEYQVARYFPELINSNLAKVYIFSILRKEKKLLYD